LIDSLGVNSLMYVPLAARGHTLGVLTFTSGESRRRYGPADLALAEALAERCAVAIDNARLYQAAQEAVATQERFTRRRLPRTAHASHQYQRLRSTA